MKIGNVEFQPSDIHEHLQFLYDAVIGTRARVILELGVRGGESTRAFAEACKKLQEIGDNPILVSVDIEDCSKVCDYDNWIFIQADDQKLKFNRPIDILFIDTSHQYEHTLYELYTFGRLVRPGGLIILHDTELDSVRKAISDFIEHGAQKDIWEFENLENCHGLGILRRK